MPTPPEPIGGPVRWSAGRRSRCRGVEDVQLQWEDGARHRRFARDRPAAALALAEAGAQVIVHYGSNAAEARATVERIMAAGGRAEAVGADLSRPNGAHEIAAKVRAVVGDQLDILVANAGISRAATIEETTPEDFDALFAVNVRAPFFLVQQLLPILKDGSSVIFTSSLAARAAVANLSAYAATRGAIDTLVKHFSRPHRRHRRA